MARSRRRSADRISNLPDDVMERILMFLPLKDAAKSSILSTKWRYLWTNLPTLVIDESFVDEIAAQRSEDTEDEVVGKLILLDVCRVLMLHRGPLINFSLSLHKWGNQVDQILRFLPYNTLQSLTIQHFNQLNFWHLSKTVFTSFSQLKTLRLSRCYFRFSSISFEGFDRLTVLELRSVMVIRRIQPQLSLRCPLLATLILVSCFSTSRIVVEEAPILECLHLDGGNVTLRHCSPFLKSVVIREIISKFLHQSESFSSTVESLSIRGILKLTTPMKQWVKLRQLSLGGLWRNINTRTEVLFVICWIMNSPNLESVAICSDKKFGLERVTENSDDGAELGDDAYNYGGSRLLRKVEVKTIRGTKNEMSLLRWLLNSSPALDQMEIQLSSALSDAEKVSFLIELNGLQRASSKARIRLVISCVSFPTKISRIRPFKLEDATSCQSVFSLHNFLNSRLCVCLNVNSLAPLFPRLTDLELHYVRFEKNLAQLRVKCPLLVTLIIESYSRYQRPIILIQEAPNHSCFCFDGCFASLCLGCSPRLKDVMIDKWIDVLGKKFGPHLLEIDGGLAAVESLCVSGQFYEEILHLQDLVEPWKKLRHLRLYGVDLSIASHLWSVVCMIICSANLQQLPVYMKMFTRDNKASLDGDDEALHMMNFGVSASNYEQSRMLLTRAELKMVRGTRNEMTLVRWLLNTSPILEEMNIQFDYVLADAWKLLAVAELNGFERASSTAQIIFQNITSSKALN